MLGYALGLFAVLFALDMSGVAFRWVANNIYK